MNKGFTLIESFIAVIVFALAMGTISTLVIMVYRTQDYAWQQSRSIEDAEIGVETMVKEIREAMIGDDGSYIIEKADDNEFIFYSDIDKDKETERVRYYIDGNNFQKEVIKPIACCPIEYIKDKDDPAYTGKTIILSHNIRNDVSDPSQYIFKYYDEDWMGQVFCDANPAEESCINNPLPTPTRLKNTRLMSVFLIINFDPEEIPKGYELMSGVQIRNLKKNL
ncbi:MAG: type II secretion system protein [Patescibacteria group bacterium]|nr:type II secretion system protein [Patescibacteria group bacterium]